MYRSRSRVGRHAATPSASVPYPHAPMASSALGVANAASEKCRTRRTAAETQVAVSLFGSFFFPPAGAPIAAPKHAPQYNTSACSTSPGCAFLFFFSCGSCASRSARSMPATAASFAAARGCRHTARVFETPPPVRLLVSFGVSSPAARSASGSAPRKVRARSAAAAARASGSTSLVPASIAANTGLRVAATHSVAPRASRSRCVRGSAGEVPRVFFSTATVGFFSSWLSFASASTQRSTKRAGWGTRGSAATTAARTSAYLSSAYATLSAATVRSTEGGGGRGDGEAPRRADTTRSPASGICARPASPEVEAGPASASSSTVSANSRSTTRRTAASPLVRPGIARVRADAPNARRGAHFASSVSKSGSAVYSRRGVVPQQDFLAQADKIL